MTRFVATTLLTVGLFAACSGVADACPLCKYANESEQADEQANLRPKAYMYSILFMLAMPASILTAFGVGIYRMSQRESDDNGALPTIDA